MAAAPAHVRKQKGVDLRGQRLGGWSRIWRCGGTQDAWYLNGLRLWPDAVYVAIDADTRGAHTALQTVQDRGRSVGDRVELDCRVLCISISPHQRRRSVLLLQRYALLNLAKDVGEFWRA